MAIAKCQRTNILPLRAHCSICILSNRMISSAIWDKSAEVNFSKTNKIARARRETAICGLWKIYECWFISKCTGKNMWLLDNNIHAKIWLAHFLFYVSPRMHRLSQLPVPAYKWQLRSRLVKILTGEYWWIKTQQLEICLSKTEAFCNLHFELFMFFHCRRWKKYNC